MPKEPPPLRRLARTCYRRRRVVVTCWVVGVVALTWAAAAAHVTFENEFALPGSESQAAVDLLEAGGFPTQAGFHGRLVVHSGSGVTEPAVRTAVSDLLDRIAAQVPDVTVASPYGPDGGFRVGRGATVAFAELDLADRSDAEYTDAVETIEGLVDSTAVPGAELALGGDRFASQEGGGSEAFGLLAAIVILFVAFGSLLAMALPIVTALFGIVAGIAVVTLAGTFVTMPSFTVQLVAMLAIGVGIDYALFVVTRYREALAGGHDPAAAVEVALDTAGRAVLFAGTTVVVSVLGLVVVGLDVNRSLGIAAACGVAATMLASVTLLPAVLGFVGANIDRFGLPHRRGGHRAEMWRRWSEQVQRRPVLYGAAALAVLVALAVPALSMRLGFGDAGNRPPSDTTRRAYDLLAEGFGPGANSPLLLAAAVPDADSRAAHDSLVADLRSTEGVAGVTPAIRNGAGDVALVQVFPADAPQAESTTTLVHHLRDEAIPVVAAGTGLVVHVGGAQAAVVDFADFNASRLPLFIAVVLTLSFLVLMVVFRSVLVPLKAVIMNLLSIGAAYGVVVAVFQWGWGADLVGSGRAGPVEAWAPMMLFAIVFGLSMDYEVFLLSRIREEYDRTGDNSTAVAHGLAATARVITAAAAIMVAVFGGFVLSSDRSLKLFGLGLAVAVLLDATVVRLVLVPATMELLGDRNWWLPRWIDAILPAVHVDAPATAGTATQPPGPPSLSGERP